MSTSSEPVSIILRIPGKWGHPRELVERLPQGHQLTPEALTLPDGTAVEFSAMQPDNQFAKIFRSSCRQPATQEELNTVDNYTVNVCLTGPGGSLDAAQAMMRAGAAVVQAGGAGVFIDNSGLAHGGRNWLAMTDDGGPDALSFAFVSIVGGKTEVWTMGMHALGLPDIVMKQADMKEGELDIVDMIRYMAQSEKPVGHGHVFADLSTLRFRAVAQDGDPRLAGSPMHNPFGRLKLVSMREIAESN